MVILIQNHHEHSSHRPGKNVTTSICKNEHLSDNRKLPSVSSDARFSRLPVIGSMQNRDVRFTRLPVIGSMQ